MSERRSKRVWIVMLGLFTMMFVFTFLTQRFKSNDEVDAANMAAFDPGYIISDYQMGNYSSMSEGDIQNFLSSKGRCGNTNFGGVGTRVDYFSDSTPPTTWHVTNGRTVCLAEENMNGESAAHIIWQAAQDYRINPQVLIVLLQKETGLITDPIPNSWDYQRATGYGCPDTAECSSKYYGFKNQIRNAAWLFRYTLDNGYSRYPIGNVYVQWNPNAGCGGSVVNIRNNATSALYRYTPYQPNASALASSYGGGDGCAAFGNRNFYSYFEDWFGGITNEGYVGLDVPRNMRLKRDAERINPYNGNVVDVLEKGMVRRFVSKIVISSGEWCLRTEYSTVNGMNACVKISDLEDYYTDFQKPRYMRLKNQSNRINPYNNEIYDTLEKGRVLEYSTKIYINGKWYYRTRHMSDYNQDVVVLADDLEEVSYEPFITPRYLLLTTDTNMVNPYTGEKIDLIKKGKIIKFTSKILIDNKWFYRSEDSTRKGDDVALISDALIEVPIYQNFITPRSLILNKDTERINPYSGEVYDRLEKGRVLDFTTKIIINGTWYYRTRYMSDLKMDVVVPASSLNEL